MLIRCIKPFRDLKTPGKPMRAVGEEWEATASRLAEINASRYGVMAEGTAAGTPETAPAARRASTSKKGAANRKAARKSD